MFISVANLTKHFQSQPGARKNSASAVHHALRDVSFSVLEGEMITLVGPSGSGKTSLLRCLAGLEAPTAGEISLQGRLVYSSAARLNIPTHQRGIGMVFQSYALWPHMTVRQNLLYALKRQRTSAGLRDAQVREYLAVVECGGLADRYPHQLSGGQQQRVALARALVYEPKVVLFDEPLSNLDASLREQLRYEIRRIQKDLGFTGIYVTHDQREAFTVGDRCALLLNGELLQFGTPGDLYKSPSNSRVASFLGAANSVEGALHEDDGRWIFESKAGKLDVTGVSRANVHSEEPVVLMTRAEDSVIVPPGQDGLSGRVQDCLVVENQCEYLVELPAGNRWRVRMPGRDLTFGVDANVTVRVLSGSALLYPATEQ